MAEKKVVEPADFVDKQAEFDEYPHHEELSGTGTFPDPGPHPDPFHAPEPEPTPAVTPPAVKPAPSKKPASPVASRALETRPADVAQPAPSPVPNPPTGQKLVSLQEELRDQLRKFEIKPPLKGANSRRLWELHYELAGLAIPDR